LQDNSRPTHPNMSRTFLVLAIVAVFARSLPAADFEPVIRRGLLVDGTDGAAFAADLAVDAGRIVLVGHVAGRGRAESHAWRAL